MEFFGKPQDYLNRVKIADGDPIPPQSQSGKPFRFMDFNDAVARLAKLWSAVDINACVCLSATRCSRRVHEQY